MPSRIVVVASRVGLHARPASLFSQAATGGVVTLTNASGRSVNAASILGVLSLGIDHGDSVTLTGDDEMALDALVSFLETDHDTD